MSCGQASGTIEKKGPRTASRSETAEPTPPTALVSVECSPKVKS